MKVRTAAILVLCGGTLSLPSALGDSQAPAPQYRVRWIDAEYYTLGGIGLNNRGEVVASTGDHVFVWHRGKIRVPTALKHLSCLDVVPFCINDREQIVGTIIMTRTGAISYVEMEGFVWDGKRLTRTGKEPGDGQFTVVTAISRTGRICGSTVQLLPAPNPDDVGSATTDAETRGVGMSLNDAGEIVGYKEEARPDGSLYPFAVAWRHGHVRRLDPPGRASMALGVNKRGLVVGWCADRSGRYHAVMWQRGTMREIAGLPDGNHSEATAVDDSGTVVGSTFYNDERRGYTGPTNGAYVHGHSARAFVWRNGRTLDLNRATALRPGELLVEARAINNQGQIAGFGLQNGAWRAFLLSPRANR